jgi:hypothetical protein
MHKHLRNCLLLVLSLGALAGCTRMTMSGNTARDDPASRRESTIAPDPRSQITRLIIDYTPAAAKQTADDARFDSGALQKAASAGLAARGLADITNPAVVRVAAIEIDEFDVRATSNVVLMGRVASAGVLGASVRIRDDSGTELRKFHVRADMSLNLVHNGTDRNTLESLYKGFTSLIADELAGTQRRSPPPAR